MIWLHRTRRLTAWFPVLAALWLLGGAGVRAQETPPDAAAPPAQSWTILDQRTGEGETCLVCNQQIYDKDVIEIRYQGRRFFVAADMMGNFEDDPQRYFARLQARAGLFDERAVGAGAMSTGWLVFGVWVVMGLVFAATCGYLAIGRGLAPLPWFFAGLAGNAAALFVLLISPRGTAVVPGTRAPVPCPRCGACNHPAAVRCGGCEAELVASAEAETARV